MNSRNVWSRWLTTVGSGAMLVGAIDPMEGSILILPGSGLVALGAWVGRRERPILHHRLWMFVLVAFGVGAMFGLSAVGGFGGPGRSMWWGVLVLPYLAGLSLSLWGPGVPRWLPVGGITVGLWYLTMPVLILVQARTHPARPVVPTVLVVLGIFGVLTIAGCLLRLRRRQPEPPASIAA